MFIVGGSGLPLTDGKAAHMSRFVQFSRACLWYTLGVAMSKSPDFVDPVTGLPINFFIIATVACLSASHGVELAGKN